MTKTTHKTLHLFRHGETDWNVIRRLQGHTDIPLNDEGRKQAQSLQKYFAANPVDVFYSSDLKRAHETAQLANSILQRPLTTHLELRESFLGELEGKTRDEVNALYGEENWQRWSSVHPEHADFRLPGAESSRDTVSRVLGALARFCHEHDFTSAGICTHGLVMRRLLHTVKPDLKNLIAVPNCGVYQITYDVELKKFHFNHSE